MPSLSPWKLGTSRIDELHIFPDAQDRGAFNITDGFQVRSLLDGAHERLHSIKGPPHREKTKLPLFYVNGDQLNVRPKRGLLAPPDGERPPLVPVAAHLTLNTLCDVASVADHLSLVPFMFPTTEPASRMAACNYSENAISYFLNLRRELVHLIRININAGPPGHGFRKITCHYSARHPKAPLRWSKLDPVAFNSQRVKEDKERKKREEGE